MATLKHFLQTGELGPIRPGMSHTEVIGFLGPPQDESVTRNPLILKYGGLQLTFLWHSDNADLRLAHIGLYFAPGAEPIPIPTLPTDINATPETTIAEVRHFLDRAGLNVDSTVEGDNTNYLILPCGTRITFDGEKLHSINFVTRATAAARKQLSVSISTDTWQRLTSLAQESKRSPSELCAEWISQRANEPQHENAGRVGGR